MNELAGEGVAYEDDEKRRERLHRRKVIEEWSTYAKAVQAADPDKRILMRDARRIAITKIENAARTQEQFENVLIPWDNMELIEKYRIRKQEPQSINTLREYMLLERDVIIPPPFGDIWWRQLLRGDFLDTLNDCPFHIEQLTTSRPVRDFIMELSDDQREILFYWALRQWSPQRIAAIRKQTDRNIRKVYNNMIADMRKKMFIRLRPRYIEELPLTKNQIKFCKDYWEQLNELEKAKLTRKFEEEERQKRKAEREANSE